jgi:hypothetical protein
MSRILCTSQPFGFGPTSTLLSIAAALKSSATVEFCGTGTAFTFAQQNSSIFAKVTETAAFAAEDLRDFDLVISVMDPVAVFEARRANVPVLLIDAIPWFWDWRARLCEADHVQGRTAQQLLSSVCSEDILALAETKPHDLMIYAYEWADAVATQGQADLRLLSSAARTHTSTVGAILNPAKQRTGTGTGPAVVSLSGTLSPINGHESARRYVDVVSHLIEASMDSSALLFTGHPYSVSMLKDRGYRAEFLDSATMSAHISRAPFLLAPAGMTTTLEAVRSGTPIGFLPEWNGSQASGHAYLSSPNKGAFPSVLFHSLLGLDDCAEADVLAQQAYSRLNCSKDVLDETLKRFQQVVRQLAIDGDAIAAMQATNIEELFGGFNGAHEVVRIANGIMSNRNISDRAA